MGGPAEIPLGAFLSLFRKPTAERVPSTARARGRGWRLRPRPHQLPGPGVCSSHLAREPTSGSPPTTGILQRPGRFVPPKTEEALPRAPGRHLAHEAGIRGGEGICVHTTRPTPPPRIIARTLVSPANAWASAHGGHMPQGTGQEAGKTASRSTQKRLRSRESRQAAPRGRGLRAGHLWGLPPGLAQSGPRSIFADPY